MYIFMANVGCCTAACSGEKTRDFTEKEGSRMRAFLMSIFLAAPLLLQADLGWFTKFLLSNRGYARNIEVETYILTQSQAAYLAANPSKKPKQLTVTELAQSSCLYLVARVKNLKKAEAWGTLSITIPGVCRNMKMSIISVYTEFSNCFICMDEHANFKSVNSLPQIIFYWNELYTY